MFQKGYGPDYGYYSLAMARYHQNDMQMLGETHLQTCQLQSWKMVKATYSGQPVDQHGEENKEPPELNKSGS